MFSIYADAVNEIEEQTGGERREGRPAHIADLRSHSRLYHPTHSDELNFELFPPDN